MSKSTYAEYVGKRVSLAAILEYLEERIEANIQAVIHENEDTPDKVTHKRIGKVRGLESALSGIRQQFGASDIG